ncbi:MAG: TIR domain-containing protein [Anaerolineaceae bacterium]|nr:TIR domain-containing protein [Anaerolineaceae bacterium]
MAHDVFVSYSNKDKPVADAVVSSLENRGIRCWVAPRDILPGSSWGEAIIAGIQKSKLMVIILSENSNRSSQVVREVERAVANNVIIIPFRIENIDPTGAMAYFLSTEHWLDAITPPMEEHINQLGNVIQTFQSSGEKPILNRLDREQLVLPKKPQKKIPIWALISLISLIIVVILGIFILNNLKPDDPQTTSTPPLVMENPTELPPTPLPTQAPAFQVIGEYRTSGSANSLYLTGNNMLYIASGTEGLIQISVADPSDPKPISIFQASSAQDVEVENDIAYIVSGDDSRQLIITRVGGNGTSTSFPGEEGALDPTRSIYNVEVENGFVHLTGHNFWGILDVSDPFIPKNIWTWVPPSHSGNPCTAFIEAEIAYIGCGWAGFFIFDLSDPTTPSLLSSFETKNWVIDIDVIDKIAYLTLGDSGLIALDVHDPAKPIMLDQLNLTGFSSDISVSGNYAYVIYLVYENNNVMDHSGVFAVDVSDPENLNLVATYDELFFGSDIQAVEDAVFITDDPRGLVVLSLDIGK